MNKLIKELAEQAGSAHKANLGVYQFYESELNQFVESIVRECLNKIENEALQYSQPTWAFELIGDIKSHFGIEE